MFDTVLFFAHYALVLLFGISLSAAFAGVQLKNKANIAILSAMFFLCSILQLAAFLFAGEALVWRFYPVITHLPLILLLCLHYRKRITTVLASVVTAYLFCQPAKWIGILCAALTQSYIAEQVVQIISLLFVGSIALYFLAPYLSLIFQKDTRSVCIFGIIPMVYYLFDYITGIYTGLWTTNSRVVAEFLPFFLCIVFMLFCIVYYKEYEQKADANHKAHIIQIIAEQQASQVEAVKKREHEIRLIRHDMRLFLSSLMVCIENGEEEKAKEMIASHTSYIEGTTLKRFCQNDTLNCVLSDYFAKCKARNILFTYTVEIENLKVDEIMFASILSNVLDNALNAQDELPTERQSIKLMLKTVDEKLLLSVTNPVNTPPIFVDGLPVTSRSGHGYGVQSIRYMTERLGGNCLFSAHDGLFIVRIIL